jgi:hypothetical protein
VVLLNPVGVDDSDAIRGPAWFDRLLAKVDRAFEVTGATTPGWSDPHPNRAPHEEEYSRVTDVGKYRILESRVDAWVEVMTDAGIAIAIDVPAEPWIGECRPPDQHSRVRRLEPTTSDGLRLLFATTLVDGGPFGLDLGISRDGEMPVLLTSVPACGCDACDSGSADLLSELDGWVLTVARGGVVHARRGKDSASRAVHGWSTANSADASWLDDSTPLPSDVERWAGGPWVLKV